MRDEDTFVEVFLEHAEAVFDYQYAMCNMFHQTNVPRHVKIPERLPSCGRRIGVFTTAQGLVQLSVLPAVVRAYGARKVSPRAELDT